MKPSRAPLMPVSTLYSRSFGIGRHRNPSAPVLFDDRPIAAGIMLPSGAAMSSLDIVGRVLRSIDTRGDRTRNDSLPPAPGMRWRSEEHTSELQSQSNLV